MPEKQGPPFSFQISLQPGLLDRLTARFNCVPLEYIQLLPVSHWLKYKMLVAFVLAIVLPLCALSWAHIVGLLMGSHPHLIYIQIFFGIFMAAGTGLMDAMLCSVIGQSVYTITTFAVMLFRWGLALCTATIISIGTVLFMLEDQLDRERTTQNLMLQQEDQKRLRDIFTLDEHQNAVTEAAKSTEQASKNLNSIPTVVQELRTSHTNCLTQLQILENTHGRRLPTLVGTSEQLQKEIKNDESPALAGRLKTVQSQIRAMHDEISRKRDECQRMQQRASTSLHIHITKANKEMEIAEQQQREIVSAARSAQNEADKKMQVLNNSTAQAWSKNFSAQVKAAWAIVKTDWSALISAVVIFTVALVNELSPMLGKIALRGGPLDQRNAYEEEVAKQHLQTQMAGHIYQQEAERCVLPDNLQQLAELNAIRRAAEAAMKNATDLHAYYETASKNTGVKDVIDEVFKTAKIKMLQHLNNIRRSAI